MSLGSVAGEGSNGVANNAGGSGNSGSGSTGGSPGAGAPAGGAAANPAVSGGAGAASSAGLGTADSGAQKSWRDSLPDDLKADPTLSKYSDLPNLAKAHIELQKKFGQKGVFKPGKDASAEEIKSFRESMGIPTDPTKYDMGQFEGVKVDQSMVDWAKKVGAEQGIEPAALKAVVTDYMKVSEANGQAAYRAALEQMKAGIEQLKSEWGEGFDRNIQRANFAAEKIGGKPLVERVVKAGIHNDPVLLKALTEVAKLYGEDKLREGGIGDGRSTPQEIDAEIAQVRSRMMAMKSSDGAYQNLKLRFESLYKQKTGGR